MAESQRLWWVIGSVALLFVVVLAGGLYWLRPQPAAIGAGVSSSGAFDPYEFVRGGDASPGLLPAEQVDVGSPESALSGSLGVRIGEAVTEEQDERETSRLSDAGSDGSVAIRRPVAAATDPTPSIRTISATAAVAARVATQPDLAREATAAGSGRAASEPRPSLAAPLAPPTVEYWIQVASFTSRGRADTVDQQLRDLGVASRITTRRAGDSLFFRVRVGPYLNEREAKKFLGWIKSVDGLTRSYISRVY